MRWNFLLVTSYQSLATNYQSLVTSHQFLVNQVPVTSCQSRTRKLANRSYWLLVFDLKNLNSQRDYCISKNIKRLFSHKNINLLQEACVKTILTYKINLLQKARSSKVSFLKFYETKEFFKSDTIFRSSRPEMLYQKRVLKNTFAGVSF